jgi:hypothetical protein
MKTHRAKVPRRAKTGAHAAAPGSPQRGAFKFDEAPAQSGSPFFFTQAPGTSGYFDTKPPEAAPGVENHNVSATGGFGPAASPVANGYGTNGPAPGPQAASPMAHGYFGRDWAIPVTPTAPMATAAFFQAKPSKPPSHESEPRATPVWSAPTGSNEQGLRHGEEPSVLQPSLVNDKEVTALAKEKARLEVAVERLAHELKLAEGSRDSFRARIDALEADVVVRCQ